MLAKIAMDNLNFEDIHGRPCQIKLSQSGPGVSNSSMSGIIITNLDATIKVEDINDMFSSFGEISSSKVETSDDGLSTTVGYVTFCNGDDAEKAIEATNGKVLGDKIVNVAKYMPDK